MKTENQHNVNIPNPDEFWNDAEVLLDKHYAKKRRRVIFGFIFSILLVVGLVANYVSNETDLSKKEQVAETTSLPQNSTINAPALENKKENASVPEITPNKLEQTKQNTPKPSLSPATITSLVAVDNKNSSAKESSNNSELAIATFDSVANAEQPLISNSGQKTTERPAPILAAQSTPKLAFLNKLNLQKSKLKLPAANMVYTQPVIDDSYVLDSKKISYTAQTYFGVNRVNKQLKSLGFLDEYASLRKSQEDIKYATYYGAAFQISKMNYLLSIGLEMNSMGENNKYKAESKKWQAKNESEWNKYTKNILVADTVYIYGIRNIVTRLKEVQDSTQVITKDSVFTFAKNDEILKANGITRLNYIEMPVLFGYSFKLGKHTLSPMAGFSVGYLYSTGGSYFNRSLSDVTPIQASQQFKKYSLNYAVQMQYSYQIYNRTLLLVAANYKANLTSITPINFGVSTKYNTIGINVGLGFKL